MKQEPAIMMVPQSYRHATMLPQSRHPTDNGKDFSQPSRPKDIPKRTRALDRRPKMLSSISASSPSEPVIIPTKPQNAKPRRSRTEDAPPKPTSPSQSHDPNALPPSMAALLAVASVQNPLGFTMRRSLSGRNIRKESLCLDDFRFALSTSSPKSWSILQSPPDKGEEEKDKEREGDSWSIASTSTVAALSSYRSQSTDSMPSLDMELDIESPESVGPPTPASRVRSNAKREKRQSHKFSLSESDHPLSPPKYAEVLPKALNEEDASGSLPTTPTTVTPSTPTSPFKSNLTASLRLLKSAARSLQSIAPKPYIPDPLPRQPASTIHNCTSTSPPLDSASASPPLPFNHLNGTRLSLVPSSFPSLPNIDALPLHLHLSSLLPTLPPSTASIQLMPYIPSPIPGSALATAPPVFLPAANPAVSAEELEKRHVSPRPRESRENSDFLRVVVLEMNMRRLGKLSGEGRAKIWLGPRTEPEGGQEVEGLVLNGVIGAEDEVEETVLKEEGEMGANIKMVQGSDGILGQDLKSKVTTLLETEGKMESKKRKTVGRNKVTRRNVPARWQGVTP